MSVPAVIFMFVTGAGGDSPNVTPNPRVASAGAGGGRTSAASAGTPT